ncbi:MAG: phosphoadenylyl-sulfate reductase [Pseudonocardiales bacterium]|nr:MAG: phosphoadenylyl-sulfate reductase [Pseudonocardiales bacterium]
MSAPEERHAELAALADKAAGELEGRPAIEILRWAADEFGERLCMTSSMADSVLAHLASQVLPGIHVIFLDTGYHFAETIGTRDAIASSLPVQVLSVRPSQTVPEQDADYGPRLYERNPDLCCRLRKVRPLEASLSPYWSWASGIRREESESRTDVPVVGWDARRGMVKVNPIAAWSQDDVDDYSERNGVIVNPLVGAGYLSIGCAPCTRAVAPGEDPRAGRWADFGKTECGLHT